MGALRKIPKLPPNAPVTAAAFNRLVDQVNALDFTVGGGLDMVNLPGMRMIRSLPVTSKARRGMAYYDSGGASGVAIPGTSGKLEPAFNAATDLYGFTFASNQLTADDDNRGSYLVIATASVQVSPLAAFEMFAECDAVFSTPARTMSQKVMTTDGAYFAVTAAGILEVMPDANIYIFRSNNAGCFLRESSLTVVEILGLNF